MTNPNVRVRIAPSPTGNLHVGTARTALFNWLFAKKYNGRFILRIEDTDLERSDEKYTRNIFDSLKAIGLDWDEGPDIGGEFGPYKQSERNEIYEKYAKKLLESGHAYYCYCTRDELENEKEQAKQEKRDYIYSGRCRRLSEDEAKNYTEQGRTPVIRFTMPEKQLLFNDLVKGEINFDTSLTGDFVIMKSNNTPTYNFAVVIDDMEMQISHVIRGEDHISNTPRQIFIYEALGAQVPQFAHVGMILAPDRSKLSKRHGATAVSEFIEQGYLPEAFVNFLALLGWSSPDEQEVKPFDEIASLFSLDRVSSTPAVFELDKLNWLNGTYIRNLPIEELSERSKKYLSEFDLSIYSEKQLHAIIDAVRNNLAKLNELPGAVSYFFGEAPDIDDEIRENILKTEQSQKILTEFARLAPDLGYSDVESIHEQLGEFRKQMKPVKPRDVMWAIRAALTGRTQGADISIVISILGKKRVLHRIQNAITAPV